MKKQKIKNDIYLLCNKSCKYHFIFSVIQIYFSVNFQTIGSNAERIIILITSPAIKGYKPIANTFLFGRNMLSCKSPKKYNTACAIINADINLTGDFVHPLSAKYPQTSAAKKNPIIYPPEGVKNGNLPENPAKTGSPAEPAAMYVKRVEEPSFLP